MRTTNLASPVRLEWLLEEDARLDARPYVGGAYEARELLNRVPGAEPLYELTAGHEGGIYNGPQFRRIWVTEPEYGVPFLGSADMLEADLTHLPLLRRADAESPKLAYLRVTEGMTLISCSGTVGRVVYARPDMGGCWSSQDMIKVVPNRERVLSGYLYAVLASRYATAILIGSRFGTGIRHIEPEHVRGIRIPRFLNGAERQIHNLVQEAAELRAAFQRKIVRATEDLFSSAGLSELVDPKWHRQERDLGFSIHSAQAITLRGYTFSPRARRIVEALRSVPHQSLGEICVRGTLRTGVRFKRIEADPRYGARLIGQRQAFWMRPDGRWISTDQAPSDVFVDDETVLIAAHGTLGENEVYGRAILVTGSWLRNVYSQDFVRVLTGTPDYPGSYLFAFLRSEAAFRLLRSMSVGGKQQEYHPALLRDLPVPECTAADRTRIADIVRDAHRNRDTADRREDKAFALLDQAIEEAIG
jgi:hypothetical protein